MFFWLLSVLPIIGFICTACQLCHIPNPPFIVLLIGTCFIFLSFALLWNVKRMPFNHFNIPIRQRAAASIRAWILQKKSRKEYGIIKKYKVPKNMYIETMYIEIKFIGVHNVWNGPSPFYSENGDWSVEAWLLSMPTPVLY